MSALRMNDAPPECSLMGVANHSFHGMELPLLVAAADEEQLEEFVYREGLLLAEVRRFRGGGQLVSDAYPPGKILILLPDWHSDVRTETAVKWWVEVADRYSVQLRSPNILPKRTSRARCWMVALFLNFLFWFFMLWLVLR